MALDRLKVANLQLNCEIWKSGVPEVSFLGHRVDSPGVHMTKVSGIVEAPAPNLQAKLAVVPGAPSILRLIPGSVTEPR